MRMLHPTASADGTSMDDDALALAYDHTVEDGHDARLRLNFVTSLDGSAQGRDGRSGSLSSQTDQRLFALLRTLADVILVGAGTVRAEHYAPVAPDEVDAGRRRALGLAALPPIAVVTRRLDLPEQLLADSADGVLVITAEAAPAHLLARLRERVEVIVAGADAVDLVAARAALVDRGHRRILCEGGPSLARDLVAADLVDEVCLTRSPLLVAGAHKSFLDGPEIDPPAGQRLGHLLLDGDDLFVRYARDRTHGEH
ncbi:MAG: dihydrofolate reductase family protein [Nocardioidaceae bacterium]